VFVAPEKSFTALPYSRAEWIAARDRLAELDPADSNS
jgi:hypothetical protein